MMGFEGGTMEVRCPHHIILREHAHSMTTADVNLDYLVKAAFMSFFYYKCTFHSFHNLSFYKQVTKFGPHSKDGGN